MNTAILPCPCSVAINRFWCAPKKLSLLLDRHATLVQQSTIALHRRMHVEQVERDLVVQLKAVLVEFALQLTPPPERASFLGVIRTIGTLAPFRGRRRPRITATADFGAWTCTATRYH